MKSLVVFAAVVGFFGCSEVMAKDQLPPTSGSVCDSGISTYLKKVGSPPHGIVRVSFNLERDNNLYFAFYGDLQKQIHGVDLDLPPVTGLKPDVAQKVYDWYKANGVWMLVLPGKDGENMAQVFVAGEAKGKPECLTLYKTPVAFAAANTPPDIFN